MQCLQSAQFVICTEESEAVGLPIHCVPMVYQGIRTEIRLWLVVCYILLLTITRIYRSSAVHCGVYNVAEGVVDLRSAIIGYGTWPFGYDQIFIQM